MSIAGESDGRIDGRSVAIVAVRLRETVYHFVRNMIVRYVIKLARARGREEVARTCDARRSVLRLNWRGRSNQRLRASDNKHRPPFDSLRRFFCTFKREVPCVYRTVAVYTYTHLAASPTVTSLFSPSFFSLFFRPPLPRTWNPLEHESLGPSLVLDGVSVGYFVDVPCRAYPVPSTVDHRRFTMPHDSRSSNNAANRRRHCTLHHGCYNHEPLSPIAVAAARSKMHWRIFFLRASARILFISFWIAI